MSGQPIIEMQIRQMSESVQHAFMARREELDEYIGAGIERALKGAPETIIGMATKAAEEAIAAEIKRYFEWGPGREAIKAAIEQSLEPMLVALRGGKL